MNIINLDSPTVINHAQLGFTESVILHGEERHHVDRHDISMLMHEIPIFLFAPQSMPECNRGNSENPATEWLGFYQHKANIMGITAPAIGLCPERIQTLARNNDELNYLLTKVIIHEFAHAKMHIHPSAVYQPKDEFYEWMEEPMANYITLDYFENFERSMQRTPKPMCVNKQATASLQYVRNFIAMQPENYKLGLDFHKNRLWYWWIWANQKEDIQKRTNEKQAWLNYVKSNAGNTEEEKLNRLFEALHE
ncbi:MAG: hypothetical protein R6U85_12295 [Salinivirgaceae bacterium]